MILAQPDVLSAHPTSQLNISTLHGIQVTNLAAVSTHMSVSCCRGTASSPMYVTCTMMSSLDLALLRFMTAATECTTVVTLRVAQTDARCSALQDRDSKPDYVARTANIVAFKRRQLRRFNDAVTCFVFNHHAALTDTLCAGPPCSAF